MDTTLIGQMTHFAQFIYYFGAVAFCAAIAFAFGALLYKIDPPPADWWNEDGE